MARTMSDEEHKQYLEVLDKQSKEIQTKEAAIQFLHKVGYCDEKGNAIFPYKQEK